MVIIGKLSLVHNECLMNVDYENPWNCIMVYPLLLMTLGTTMVLSTESQTFVQENNILEENTSYKKENPKEEKKSHLESDWKRYFGSSEK